MTKTPADERLESGDHAPGRRPLALIAALALLVGALALGWRPGVREEPSASPVTAAVEEGEAGEPERRHWTGRLLNPFGEPFVGTGNLRLEELERGEQVTVPVDASGRFDAVLTPGLWQVRAHCTGSPSSGFDLGRHRVELDREQDLLVPGIRLVGRLTPPDEVKGDPAEHPWTTVELRPRGFLYPGAVRRAGVDAAGRYTIDGLAPGTWLVSIRPGELAMPEPEVVLEAGDSEVVLDLVR